MKTCSKCRDTLPLDLFCKSKGRKDGLNPSCKLCAKAWREANKEVLQAKKKEYYHRDLDGMRQKLRDRYASDPEKYKSVQRKYYSSIEGRRKRILMRAKETANNRGHEFNLDIDDIQIPKHCKYLGVILTHDLGYGQQRYNSSIDRIDSLRGYVKGNVQIVSRLANSMKANSTREERIMFALNVLKEEGLEGTTLEKYTEKFQGAV